MPETVERLQVAPRCLAGGGDPAWITGALHHACGWRLDHDPLRPDILLTSPDQQATLALEPGPRQQWWNLKHAPAGDRPAWGASFGAHTPVEIIAAVTDALTDPAPHPSGNTPEPLETLRQAGWRDDPERGGLRTPDGLAHIQHFTARGSNIWFVTTAVGPEPGDFVWATYLNGNAPPRLIHALTSALADTSPVTRDPLALPTGVRERARTRTIHEPAAKAAVALERRIHELAARTAPSPPPGPAPQHTPPPRRTR